MGTLLQLEVVNFVAVLDGRNPLRAELRSIIDRSFVDQDLVLVKDLHHQGFVDLILPQEVFVKIFVNSLFIEAELWINPITHSDSRKFGLDLIVEVCLNIS